MTLTTKGAGLVPGAQQNGGTIMVRVKLKRATRIGSVSGRPGEVHEVPEKTAAMLQHHGKAEIVDASTKAPKAPAAEPAEPPKRKRGRPRKKPAADDAE